VPVGHFQSFFGTSCGELWACVGTSLMTVAVPMFYGC
jgi:hypothetical protein